jgi:hypothetical protein
VYTRLYETIHHPGHGTARALFKSDNSKKSFASTLVLDSAAAAVASGRRIGDGSGLDLFDLRVP